MMPAASKSAARTFQIRSTIVAFGLIGAALAFSGMDFARPLAAWTPRAPDFSLIAQQSLVLKTHLFAAIGAFAIGCVIMLRPKGRGLHKALGWSWVVAMAVTAVSSFFLTSLNGDALSFIHLISGWTIIMLPMAIVAIRRRNVTAHRKHMTGLFTGGLVIAGALTFLPGRLMWHVFFG